MRVLHQLIVTTALLMGLNNGYADSDQLSRALATWRCTGAECQEPWGYTGFGQMSLSTVARQMVGANPSVAFVQYSRANDDTPAGADPTAYLRKLLGDDFRSEILAKTADGQFLHRAEIVEHLQSIVQAEPSFYEVFAQTYAIAVSAPSCQERGCGSDVSIINILESSSGRYENSPQLQGFRVKVAVGEQQFNLGYSTHYQVGRGVKSTARDKIGTLSVAATPTFLLHDGVGHVATLTVESMFGKVFKTCTLTFALPLDASTQINCERFKFPPLLAIRSNLDNVALDSFRYRQPPLEGECVAVEKVGDGALSDNSLIGAYLRQSDTCIGCHAVTSEEQHPMGGDLLCPQSENADDAEHSAFGTPKNPNLMSHLILSYFLDPRLENVPKSSRAMRVDLENLRRAYCDKQIFAVEGTTYNLQPVLEGWIKNYDNPRTLDYKKVCN